MAANNAANAATCQYNGLMRHACIADSIDPVLPGGKHGQKKSTSDDEILHVAAKRRIPEHG
jgi:hypothetical protein